MQRVIDYLRDHLLESVGYPREVRSHRSYEELSVTEWCPQFEKYMRNRLILGSMRYGLLGDPSKPQWDRIGRMRVELDRYVATGDTECLVEIANHALLEFVEGVHPLKHFAGRCDGIHTDLVKR